MKSGLVLSLFLVATPAVGQTTLSPEDQTYDARLRSAMAAAQALRGPLEGGWIVAANGQDLYALELTDRNGVVDGAWRDLRRAGALDASGFIAPAERADGRLTLRLGARRVSLGLDRDGSWRGTLLGDAGDQEVSLRRAP